VPEVVRRGDVRAWAFERTMEPVPVVALLLDADDGAMADIVDVCEDMLSSRLLDEPALVMQPLVDMPGRAANGNLPWGVRHSRVDATNAAKLRQHLDQEQAISEVVLSVVRNVRALHWDRKTIAPNLLAGVLKGVVGEAQLHTDAFRIMQQLLLEHPANESLTRQFRMNAHKLVKAGVPILLEGESLDEFVAELGVPMEHLGASLASRNIKDDITVLAAVWKRLAAGIGFSAVEAAYLACLVASNAKGEQ
jgi:hypothetical protein